MIMLKRPAGSEGRGGSKPRFGPGELVRHKRYGYRGVVVHADPRCLGDDEWYYSNQTQPDRNQPWYHVLVDGSSTTTYPAQENLEPDQSGEPVDHPLVDHFFGEFRDGRYVRNDEPWVG